MLRILSTFFSQRIFSNKKDTQYIYQECRCNEIMFKTNLSSSLLPSMFDNKRWYLIRILKKHARWLRKQLLASNITFNCDYIFLVRKKSRIIIKETHSDSNGKGVWVSKIIPSYLRRSFPTLLKGSSSGKFGIHLICIRILSQIRVWVWVKR
jgi:hypothetical protein